MFMYTFAFKFFSLNLNDQVNVHLILPVIFILLFKPLAEAWELRVQSADHGSFREDLRCANQRFSSAGAQKRPKCTSGAPLNLNQVHSIVYSYHYLNGFETVLEHYGMSREQGRAS